MNGVIGIDPGKRGGLAFLAAGTEGLHVVDLLPMPTSTATKHALDSVEIKRWIQACDAQCTDGFFFVYIERVHAMPGQGVVSMFTFGFDAGQLAGLVYGLGHTPRYVEPRAWKKQLLGDQYRHDKAGTLDWATRTHPFAVLTPVRCRKPHDGIIDALAIASYGASLCSLHQPIGVL